jgi:Na+/H+ antiporter NhaB
MKKFIFTANVVAIIALVPAVIFGYLHEDTKKDNNKESIEIVKDTHVNQEESTILRLIRTF